MVSPLLSAAAETAPAAVNLSVGDLEAQLSGGAATAAMSAPVQELSLAEQVSDVARERSEDSVKALQTWISQG